MTAPAVAKPDPKAWYVCIENHTSDRGIYREGDRLRGDHIDVKAATLYWVSDDLDADQINELRQARLYAARPEERN
jgi:hypothetical protein